MLRLQFTALFLILPFFSSMTFAGNKAVLGQWDTLDRDGNPQSLVELYLDGKELQGRIVKLYDETKQDAVCKECKDERQNQPIEGLIFITGLTADDDQWVDGRVVDPETGSEYDCKLWLDGETLKLKAGFGFIGQTRNWKRPAE